MKSRKIKDLIAENKQLKIKEIIIKHAELFLYGRDKNAKTNSWSWVADIRKRLRKQRHTHSFASSFEEQYELLQEFNSVNGEPFIPRIQDEITTFNKCPLLCFLDAIDEGSYPSPELLLSIADGFKIYLSSEGKISLEEAFFDLPKKGVGNYSASLALKKKYEKFHNAYWLERSLKKQQPSLTLFAEKYFNGDHFIAQTVKQYEISNNIKPKKDNLIDLDIDSFLRGYRRWRKEVEQKNTSDEKTL